MTPDLLSRVREAFFEATRGDGKSDDEGLAAVIAVVQEDRTREIVEFIGPHFMGAHVNAGVVAGAVTREFGGTTHD